VWTAELAELVTAEAHAAGASGLEERTGEGTEAGSVTLLVYAPASAADDVRAALQGVVARAAAGAGEVGALESVADVAWEERWRDGLGVVRISPRLAVRPSFVPDDSAPDHPAIVVEPGQAFGTGSHQSTWLALALLDDLPEPVLEGARVLDVGTGSGVLALAAVALGARRAIGLDLDPLAARAARDNARANAWSSGVAWFTGPIGALSGPPFDLVLANLLRSEMEPLIGDIALRLRFGGYAILSGLLAEDLGRVEPKLRSAGLEPDTSLERTDADGARWIGLRALRV
jgi:ribosomal protein L11 methyltransferase